MGDPDPRQRGPQPAIPMQHSATPFETPSVHDPCRQEQLLNQRTLSESQPDRLGIDAGWRLATPTTTRSPSSRPLYSSTLRHWLFIGAHCLSCFATEYLDVSGSTHEVYPYRNCSLTTCAGLESRRRKETRRLRRKIGYGITPNGFSVS